MYLSKKNSFYHGIMFHHFHDKNLHKKSQGSISENDFYKIIKFLGRNNILDASEFAQRLKEGKLKKNNLCLTFDDGIKSQYDIALPVLEDLQIKSFFYVYSSLLEKKPDLLEVYRFFRTNYFKNINEFYKDFFNSCGKNLANFFNKNKNQIKIKKKHYFFYSENDIKFRLVRDNFLDTDEYNEIMNNLFLKKKFNPKKFFNILFMNKRNLRHLYNLGHQIGLHSHSHPTFFEKLDYKTQYYEYKKNRNILSKVLNCNKYKINSMSHPCGSYNNKTLKVLENLGVDLGFRNKMLIDKSMKKINNSKYEIARQDHSYIIKLMR